VALHVAPEDDGHWLLNIDYPSLDRAEVYLLQAGRVVRQTTLGDHLPYAQRWMPARTHVLPLVMDPGGDYEIWLRAETQGTLILPLRLVKHERYASDEALFQLLQGLAAGIALCMMMYALAHWRSTRESMFLYYAGTVAGIALFFFAYHGLAPQYLWPHNAWLTANTAPLAVLLGLAGGLPLVERLLDVRALYPRLSKVMLGGGLFSLAVACLFVLDLVSYRHAHIIATVLGPTPVVLAVRVAWVRWRQQGDPAAPYLFAGWGVYLVGVGVMAALLRGWLDSDVWSQNAFQVASMVEAAMWLRVLGVRHEQIRGEAEKATRERELLQTLAYTDPLTGLPNRRGLEQALQAALPASGASHVLVVYLLDLDGFKAVNDRLGHEAGDQLLRLVAQRLRLELRHRDVVARLGGDEFVVLARDLAGEPEAWQLGRKLVAAFKQPFEVDSQPCRVGLTVGFALAPLDGHDAASLLRRADAAMYAGKQSGKGTVRRGAASVGLVDVH
jgi:diguanylate cyclase (GGDEF)-like protein